MRNLIDLVVVYRIVAGTDFPQRMAVARLIEFVEAVPGLSQCERRPILSRSPACLRGLDRSVA